MIPIPPIITFIVATGLSVFSLLSIVVYKDHHLLASRPENIFVSLLQRFEDNLSLVVDPDKPWLHTLALSKQAREAINQSISLVSRFYSDLTRNGDIQAASIAMQVIVRMLLKYSGVKHLVREELTNWFPQELQPLDMNDWVVGPIARSLSIQGKGPGALPQTNLYWLEEYLLKTLIVMQQQVECRGDADKQTLLIALLKCYEGLLGGFSGEPGRANNKSEGLFELQDYETHKRVLGNFVALWQYARNMDSSIAQYLNTLHFSGFIIIASNIEAEIKIAQEHISRRDGFADETTLYSLGLHRTTYQRVRQYRQMVDAESRIEGKTVTPCEIMKSQLDSCLRTAHNEMVRARFVEVFRHSQECMDYLRQESRFSLCWACFKLQLNWIKQAFAEGKSLLIGELEGAFQNELLQLLLSDNDIGPVREWNLMSELQDVAFLALSSREKELFDKAVHFYFRIIHRELLENQDKDSNRELTKLWRAIVNLASLCFGLSELDQDRYWVSKVTELLLTVCRDSSHIVDILGLFSKPSFLLSTRESIQELAYYDRWHKWLETEICKLPMISETMGYSPIPRSRYDHPSVLIQRLSPDYLLYDREGFIEGYQKWLEDNYPAEGMSLKDQ